VQEIIAAVWLTDVVMKSVFIS